jgi:hypothetical protein
MMIVVMLIAIILFVVMLIVAAPSLQAIETEDEFLAVANSDISQLCGELVLLWNNFLNICLGRKAIR